MSPLLHFVDNQNIFCKIQKQSSKEFLEKCFISCFRLKVIVVGKYTTRSDYQFTDSFTYILDLSKI